MPYPIRDILKQDRIPTPGKVQTDSRDYPGHDNRMASHIHRIWNHRCERVDGGRCDDCIYRRRRS